MALVLNEEQTMLKDSARDFLDGSAPVSHLRALRDDNNPDGFSRALWAEMTEMGWSAILVPEQHGGLEYGFTGLGVVLEECGRSLTPSPLLSSALSAVTALNLAGSEKQNSEMLSSIASGDSLIALACDETARHAPESVNCKADATENGFVLSGRKTAVLDGNTADTFIVTADSGNGVSLFLVPANANGVTVESYPVLDTHKGCNVSFDQVTLTHDSLLGELNGGGALLERVLDAARIGASAEMLGIAQEAFERTMTYLKDRKQFGVQIGVFQALQHRAAQLWGEIEMCKSLVLKALQSLDEDNQDIAELASLTKAKVGETARTATLEAIQMHGGIGMTDEFDIGFFLKRCQTLDTLYGDRYFHLDRYAKLRGY